MNIRFRVHDRRAFPSGIVLDITDQATLDALASALQDTGKGLTADAPLRSPRGVTYANLWLTDPTEAGLVAELARISGIAEKHLAKEELAADDARIRREQVAERAKKLREKEPEPPAEVSVQAAAAAANATGRGRV